MATSKAIKPLTSEDEARVVDVLERVRSSAGAMQDTADAGVASEVIHEQVCSHAFKHFHVNLALTHQTGSRSRRRSGRRG
jgi:hypothetical protein